jgi:hypothetical protein
MTFAFIEIQIEDARCLFGGSQTPRGWEGNPQMTRIFADSEVALCVNRRCNERSEARPANLRIKNASFGHFRQSRSPNNAAGRARKTGFQPVPARRHPACAERTLRCARRQAGSPPAVTGWKPVFRRTANRPIAESRLRGCGISGDALSRSDGLMVAVGFSPRTPHESVPSRSDACPRQRRAAENFQ